MVKYFIRTEETDSKTSEVISSTEKEYDNLEELKKNLKEGEKVHICRHDEGEPCTLE
jgi:predicted RND superfamily exporter protein